MGSTDKWALVRIPKELKEIAEEAIKHDSRYKMMGFTSLSSFATYLMQRELDRYSKSKPHKNH